jgi:tetratricopeptide (TPR) repeat protein
MLRRIPPRIGVPAIVATVLFFSARTWVRNADWHDDYALFVATAATSPNSARAQANGGAVLAQRGAFAEAHEHYALATRIAPDFAPGEIGLGRLLAMQGRAQEAVVAFDRARAADPSRVEAHLNAGDLRLGQGDAAGAARTYREGLVVAPGQPELRLGLALAEAALGHRDEARRLREGLDGDHVPPGTNVPQRLAALADVLGEQR